METSGPAPAEREGPASACVGSNLFIFGGTSLLYFSNWSKGSYIGLSGVSVFGDLSSLDTQTMQWTKVPVPNFVPALECATASAVGATIYIFGGASRPGLSRFLPSSRQLSNKMFAYNAELKTWKELTVASGVKARFAHSASIVGHKIFIFGGQFSTETSNELLSFNTNTGTWKFYTDCQGAPKPRKDHSSAVVEDRIFIFGGTNQDIFLTDGLHIFDSKKRSWICIQLHNQVPAATAVIAHESSLLQVSGVLGQSVSSDVWEIQLPESFTGISKEEIISDPSTHEHVVL